MRSTIISLLILVFFTFCSLAQNPSDYWNEVHPPWGGTVQLTQLPSGTLYAQHPTKRAIFRSGDEGQNWTTLTHFADNPDLDFTFFTIGHAGGFYYKSNVWHKSNNEGASWTPLSNATSSFLRLVEMPSGTLIAYGNDNLFRSTDGGQTWAAVYPNGLSFISSSSLYLEIFPDQSIVLKAYGTNNLIFRSTDDGQTWTQRGLGQDYELEMITPDGAFILYNASGAPNLVNELVRQQLPSSPLVHVGDFLPITGYHFLSSGRILMSADEDLFYSDDDGLTWTVFHSSLGEIEHELIPNVQLTDGSFFCNVLDALHKSSDGGLTMNFSARGIDKPTVEQIRFLSDSSYMVSLPTGIWKTANKGANWNRILTEPSGDFEITPAGGILSLSNRKLFYAPPGSSQFTNISPTTSGIFAYTDRLYYNPFNNAIFANHSQGGSSGLIRSLDFGQNWQFNSTATIQAMTFHPSGVILATNNFTIFRSIDGGIQWNNTALDGVISIDNLWTSPDGLNYVIGTKNFSTYILFSSEDAGQTWVELGELPTLDFDYELAFSSNGYIFLSDNNQVFGSFNRGETWQSLPLFKEEDPISFIYKNRLSITPEQRLYVTSQELHHYMSKEPVMNGALVEGHIKVDSDADCSTEDSQAPFKNVVIEAKGTNYSYYTNTDDQGKYLFFVDTGAYEVKPKVPNQLWWSFCDTTQLTVLTELFEHDTLDFAALALVDCPLISVDLGLNTLRRCFNNEVFVQYCNQGTQPADSAWVDVMLDPFLSFMGSSQLHTELNNNTVRFFVGDVPSGDCGQFQLTVYVNCDSTVLGQTHCITAHGFPDTICFSTPNWSGAEIQASVACQDTAVLFKLQNVGDAQSQILDYIIIEDDVVMFQGSQNYTPDEFLEIPISANGHTYRIESEQEPGHPFSTLALAFQEGCGGYESLGFINHFTVNGRTPSWHTICEENTGSYDPNDKHGYPTGVGEDHRILPGQPVEYRIRFQNTGTDTAFTVVIRDTLSTLLDPSTLAMGASSHNYTWQLEGAGILKITFNNINLPDSNVNWENSQGFVRFRIAQKPNLPLGTQLFNSAGIYFDFNEAVITNETWHTIGFPDAVDAKEPTSDTQRMVLVTPNPAEHVAHFRVVSDQNEPYLLQLYNPLGMIVSQYTVGNNQLELLRRNLPAGAYRWVLKSATGEPVESGVLIFK